MYITLGLVALGVFLADQAVKLLVENTLTLGEDVHVWGDVLILHYVKNSGAAFSLGAGSTWIFTIIQTVVAIAVIVFAPRVRSKTWGVFLGLLLGGALGNVFDRYFREPSFGLGHVVDYISTPWLIPAIYNIADISICVAMGLFVILTIRGIRLDGTRIPAKGAEENAAGDEGTDAVASVAEAPRDGSARNDGARDDTASGRA